MDMCLISGISTQTIRDTLWLRHQECLKREENARQKGFPPQIVTHWAVEADKARMALGEVNDSME